ncbi:hypothetical protein ACWGJP_04675 [Microbacterium sp. NPDC055903]
MSSRRIPRRALTTRGAGKAGAPIMAHRAVVTALDTVSFSTERGTRAAKVE